MSLSKSLYVWHSREVCIFLGLLGIFIKATTLDFLNILGILFVPIHSLNMSRNHWSAAGSEVFDLLAEDVVKSGCFVDFHFQNCS